MPAEPRGATWTRMALRELDAYAYRSSEEREMLKRWCRNDAERRGKRVNLFDVRRNAHRLALRAKSVTIAS